MRHDALGISGRARCVRQRDRVPLIGRKAPVEVRIAARNEILVLGFAQQFAACSESVVDVDDQRRALDLAQRLCNRGGILAVGDQHLCLTVRQHERDRL